MHVYIQIFFFFTSIRFLTTDKNTYAKPNPMAHAGAMLVYLLKFCNLVEVVLKKKDPAVIIASKASTLMIMF